MPCTSAALLYVSVFFQIHFYAEGSPFRFQLAPKLSSGTRAVGAMVHLPAAAARIPSRASGADTPRARAWGDHTIARQLRDRWSAAPRAAQGLRLIQVTQAPPASPSYSPSRLPRRRSADGRQPRHGGGGCAMTIASTNTLRTYPRVCSAYEHPLEPAPAAPIPSRASGANNPRTGASGACTIARLWREHPYNRRLRRLHHHTTAGGGGGRGAVNPQTYIMPRVAGLGRINSSC